VFVGFFLLILVVYWNIPHRRQNQFLLVASYFFYGYWDWRFTFLLAFSTLVDFNVAKFVENSKDARTRKKWLWVSCIVNLGLLGTFKYFNFFVDSAASLLESVGLEANLPALSVILPVGISFYTFQTLAYTVDVYRGEQKATKDFIGYAVYVCYFPQLVAGPIERAKRLLPQIQSPRSTSPAKWNSGVQLILWGFLKKIAIADTLAPLVERAFEDPTAQHGAFLWVGMYAFALQIYGDFSGYSDIARGTSRLLGIELIENFRAPYLSSNIVHFWRRWHISLSNWLRDYLYIPLGGNRLGPFKQYRNLMITMLLGGLWHGAGWTFILWGGLHGMYLAVYRFFKERVLGQTVKDFQKGSWTMRFLGIIFTFHLVCLAWIPFRAPSWKILQDYVTTLVSPASWAASENALPNGILLQTVFYGVIVLILDLLIWHNDSELPFQEKHPWWLRGIAYGLGLTILAYVRGVSSGTFIYFQF
jgi:D-alanyl-lipoteichoic acid acyltransferase DltB (MBOAT superfamily)